MRTNMRKIWMLAMAAVTMMALSACDNDPDPWDWGHPGWANGGGSHGGWNNGQGNQGGSSQGQLNSYEQALVGSYVSDDDPQSLFYLVLYRNHTGNYKSVKNGTTTGDSFTWSATQNTLRVTYDSSKQTSDMNYYTRDNHLYVDGIPLVTNNGQQPAASTAVYVGQWQGVLSGYYKDAWNLSGGSYATVIEFTSTGAGCQLDYDVTAPAKNYAYNPFTWKENGKTVSITYASDSQLPDATMTDYGKSGNFLQGKLTYVANVQGQEKTFAYQFSFVALKYFDWSQYGASSSSKTRSVAGLSFSMSRAMSDGKVKTAGAFAHGSLLK